MTESIQPFAGLIRGLSNQDYHQGPGTSKSFLWTLYSKSPAHARYGVKKATPQMDKGSLVHCAVLEPEAFEARYAVGPDAARNTKEWKAAEAAAEGKTLVKPDEWEQARAVRDVLWADRTLKGIFEGDGEAEVSCFWQDELSGELCKCRPDLMSLDIVLDLKTIGDASGDGCRKAVEMYGYHAQRAFYGDGLKQVTDIERPFLFVFAETEPPYAYRLVELDYEYLKIGRQIYRTALDTYAACKRADLWPAYPTAIQRLEPSSWERRRSDNSIIPEAMP